MISVKNIHIAFDTTVVLKDFSFIVPQGTVCALLGKNGCGKSVLLKAIAGLVPIASGEILVDSVPPGEELYDTTPPRLSYVFQKGGLFDSISVFENIAFYLRRQKIESEIIDEKVNTVISRVGLTGNENRLPSELSGGMQKRVCLARAAVSGSSHILYDDPSAGLDPVLTDSIGRMINEIRYENNVTSLLVTHDMDLVKKVADFVIVMHNGVEVFSGSTDHFFNGNHLVPVQFTQGLLTGPIEPL